MAEALGTERRRAVGRALPRALARVHDVDIAAVGLADLASHAPYAPRQLRRWARQWEATRTRNLPELDDLTRRLTAAVPEQTELTLVHGDFHLRSLVLSREDDAVIAVLDWELATLGDPLADVGTMLAYWVQAGDAHASDRALTVLDGFPDRAELARAYLAETGRDAAQLGSWHALGLWKVAIIAEGVMRRAQHQPASRASAGTPTVPWIDAVLALARDTADRAGI